ncbi:MAG: glycosyltransferase family 2 protein [Acidobacteria bacterium]|nr:glycosyltransferase family 2 protein [Acidobacteriota bacterium]
MAVVVLDAGGHASTVDTVRAVLAQTPSPEVIVVSVGGGDIDRQLAAAGIDVMVVQSVDRLSPSSASNIGAAATDAPQFAVLPRDCIVEPGWVAAHLRAHAEGAAVVSSPVRRRAPWQRLAAAARRWWTVARPSAADDTPADTVYSYSRQGLWSVGPFAGDPDTGAGVVVREAVAGSLRETRLDRSMVSCRPPSRRPRAGLAPAAASGASAPPAEPARRAPGPVRATAGHRRRVVSLLTFRNERRYLKDYLANVTPQLDGIVALDDGSADGSAELLAGHPAVLEVLRIAPRVPHRWNGVGHRRLLVDAAARHGAEWALALDADERIERGFRDRAERLIEDAGPEGPMAYAVTLRELWDRPDQYRVDGVWGRKAVARFFRIRPDHDFGTGALHGHWAPENSRGPGGPYVRADLTIYHLKMIAAADRERRMRRYTALDPDRRWQKIGYGYLVDATGLEVEPLPPGREYEPLAALTDATAEVGPLVPVVLAGRVAMVEQ